MQRCGLIAVVMLLGVVITACLSAPALFQGLPAEYEVVSQVKGPTSEIYHVLLTPGRDDEDELENEAVRIASKLDTRKVRYFELVLSASREELKLDTTTTPEHVEAPQSISDTLELIQSRGGLPRLPIARVLRVFDGTVLSVRGKGPYTVSRTNVKNTPLGSDVDVSVINSGNGRLRLLRCSDSDTGSICFLSAITQIQCADAKQVGDRLRNFFGVEMVELAIREDAWFADRHFPVAFRFKPDDEGLTYGTLGFLRAPFVQEYYRRGMELGATVRRSEFRCTVFGVKEQVRFGQK